ncbi:proline--tRNA ligase [Limisalsivibrio acetivorans]|uniref:proline--tRNA ligase n=1 Tax=Limisalsivibrio acetivorans TaxID=1304888 RepID=UPI0003B6B48C|nr:proline--tRNA ligase [Limisalsivibrio acetivorans]
MRLSRYFIPTLREIPAEAEVISHKYMLRAGMIKKIASGIYDYLPVGLRVIRKVENIVRQCMNDAGAIEMLMPAVQPAELWQESGRWSIYGKELLRMKDRHDRDFCMGPTHEEVTTDIVRDFLTSYKQLPVNFYQIQNKFRDEVRPRFGLMRGREFIMKDAYSFDVDDAGASKSYEKMREAYCRIFDLCGLEYTMVDADSGAIGGSYSHEFMVLADTGEDAVMSTDKGGYAANLEKAVCADNWLPSEEPERESERVETPKAHTVEEVAEFLSQPIEKIVKTMIVNADGKFYAFMVRGDHELNLAKAKNALGADTAELAAPADIVEVTGGAVGFSGPCGLDIPVFADFAVKAMRNMTVGGNEKDVHVINTNADRDFNVTGYGDYRNAVEGDICPEDGGKYKLTRGIEVGHIFKLGTKYSEAMNCVYLDKEGKRHPMLMGCYGIGITRVVAAAIEQNHDEKGIIWPVQLAPYKVVVVPVNTNDEAVMNMAENIYKELESLNVEVMLDDRDERAGVKFTDAELVGYPIRVTIGKKALAEGNVEINIRKTGETVTAKKADCISRVLKLIKELS